MHTANFCTETLCSDPRLFTFRAATAASRSMDCKSAPENPLVRESTAMEGRSTSGDRGVFLARAVRIAARPLGDGKGTYRVLSRRPGLHANFHLVRKLNSFNLT